MKYSIYHRLNTDKSVSGIVYTLYVLIQSEQSRTKDYLLEKESTTNDVTVRTYFESNESVESIPDAWNDRANKVYSNFYDFKGVFANNF